MSTHSDETEVRDRQHRRAILQRRGHGHREILLRHVLRRAEARILRVEGPVVERGPEELRRIKTVGHVRRWAVREGDDDGDLLRAGEGILRRRGDQCGVRVRRGGRVRTGRLT